jgi:hypothetical protein
LAPVIHSPESNWKVTVSAQPELKVATMAREHLGTNYIFAVAMENRPGKVALKTSELSRVGSVEVIDEARTVTVTSGEFSDEFKPYEVHLYRFQAAK